MLYCNFSSDSFHYMLSFLNVPQGEDGFPGAKGDMGIKGDQVSQVSEPFSFRYSKIEDKTSTCLLTLNLHYRVIMEHQVLVERTDQKGTRVKVDPWEIQDLLG